MIHLSADVIFNLKNRKGKIMWLDKESQIDLLAYSPFAGLITNITANERLNPLTIGLFGRWGAGKSTLLKLVEKILKKEIIQRKDLFVFH